MNKTKILCTVCARRGSKRLKSKNFLSFLNKPLIFYTLKIADISNLYTDIVVSTDCKKIASYTKKNFKNFIIRKRSRNLSHDKASKIDVIKDALSYCEKIKNERYDYIMDLDVTSPMRQVSDLKKSINLIKKKKFDNIVSVVESRKSPYFNIIERKKNGKFFRVKNRPFKWINRSQDSPKTYSLNASIYIWRNKALKKFKTIYDGNLGIYLMKEESQFDIDTKTDFKIVEYLYKLKLK